MERLISTHFCGFPLYQFRCCDILLGLRVFSRQMSKIPNSSGFIFWWKIKTQYSHTVPINRMLIRRTSIGSPKTPPLLQWVICTISLQNWHLYLSNFSIVENSFSQIYKLWGLLNFKVTSQLFFLALTHFKVLYLT